MRDLNEAARWLTQAADEYADAEMLRQMGRYYLALFHFQQAAEKALKAYLIAQLGGREVSRIHSVGELGRIAAEIQPDFLAVSGAKQLDAYYVPTRYPNGIPGNVPSRFYTDPAEAERASDLAGSVVRLVQRLMADG